MNNYKTGVFFTAFGTLIFAVIFFFQPALIMDGVRNGLTVCGSSVIPSLFPFMVLSDFLVRSGFGKIAGKKISRLTQFLFNLPGAAGCTVIMSLTGGFPVGAKMTVQLFERGEITQRQGRRMLMFCVNGGPAFVIGTVGSVMLGSTRAGLILFVSLTLTSVLIGIASGLLDKEKVRTENTEKTTYDGGVIGESVNQGINGMLNVCGWIILISGINGFILKLPLGSLLPWVTMLTEVTNGCLTASTCFPACVLAFVLGWSGLAVHCQILTCIKKLNMKISIFWLSRIVAGGLATAISFVLFKIFPCEITVFSSLSGIVPKAWSVSAPASAAMLVLSGIMLVDLKSCVKEKAVV